MAGIVGVVELEVIITLLLTLRFVQSGLPIPCRDFYLNLKMVPRILVNT